MPRYFAIVPAAGSGSRFGAEKPKQYLDLLGRPLLFHTLQALVSTPEIERVWVVLSPDDDWWSQYDWSELGSKLETLRCGGATRAASVANGLQAALMVASDDDWILVHDAARWEELVKRPHGIILVTGPTGSGKTVFLGTCLALLAGQGVDSPRLQAELLLAHATRTAVSRSVPEVRKNFMRSLRRRRACCSIVATSSANREASWLHSTPLPPRSAAR